MPAFTLVSHSLCPYVQRAAIVLLEKAAPFERRTIDLADKPEWFLAVSPLGKTPVLLVDDQALFESAAICEYLDETLAPRMHPDDPIERARHRGWVEFASAVLNTIGGFYSAPHATALEAKAADLRGKFAQFEASLGAVPFFAGERFGLVDAAFAPVFRYFEVFDAVGDFGCLDGLPKIHAWRKALAARDSVRRAADPRYGELLRDFLRKRDSELSRRMRLSTTVDR